MKEDCIFCKIIRGEMPASKVYEDSKVVAFLDIAPCNPGHTIIIPKEHYDTFAETPAAVLKDLIECAKKIAPGVMAGTGAEGFNLTTNNGTVAGQIIFHVHFHLIPRFPADGHRTWSQSRYQDDEVKEETAQKIKKYIK